MKKQTRALTETAILVSIAIVLDIIFGAVFPFPLGGSISVAMLPIFILTYRRGLQYGIIGGAIFGLISFLNKPYFLNFLQFSLDYLFAFGALGLGALISKKVPGVKRIVLVMIIGGFARYIIATLAGVAYWAEWIPDEMEWIDGIFGTSLATSLSGNALIFIGAFLYNGLYMIPSILLCVIIGIIMFNRGIVTINLNGVA